MTRPARPGPRRATVLLADDHGSSWRDSRVFCAGEFALVGTVADGARLIEAARELRPDVS